MDGPEIFKVLTRPAGMWVACVLELGNGQPDQLVTCWIRLSTKPPFFDLFATPASNSFY
jgi:hypothetical protein